MSKHHFLAFDFGAESGRSILATLENGKLSFKQTHRFPNPNGTMNGTMQWDLLGQWEQIKTGLRETAKVLDGTLSGIGVDTWGVDYGLLGGDGQILGNPVCYRDPLTLDIAPADTELHLTRHAIRVVSTFRSLRTRGCNCR